jgi:hypothetical protein
MNSAMPQTTDEIYSWVVNILHEMFELDKAKIHASSKPIQ